MPVPVFPRSADNDYLGSRIAVVFLVVIVLLKTLMGLNCIFNGRAVASSADGIPIDSFTPDCARMVVNNFATWGLGQLALCLVGAAVLVRYRAMIPAMFAILLLEHLSRKAIHAALPIARTGTPPGVFVNLALLALMIAGLGLSLWRRDRPRPAE